ncbi:MAG: hypothetical protein N3G21_12995 [Candidatus Hydrogenedentes bacterium]|nr:hypothetical protein [Candidatus Hydrogenedentota bacterium]
MTQLLLKAHKYWSKLSNREQLLLLGVLICGLMFTLNLVYRSANNYLHELDNAIDRLQQDLINYSHQVALKQVVDAEYAQVALQHSSKWSEAEIHDRLRQELYRLAQKYIPELDDEGIPVRTVTSTGPLIQIPSLQQGVLRNIDQNYREYTINLKIPYADFTSTISFLQRLLSSPQSLRIDNLDLRRSPFDDKVYAEMDITRIITAGLTEVQSAGGSSGIELSLDPIDWSFTGGTLTKTSDSVLKKSYMIAESNDNRMEIFFVRAFRPGEKWMLEIELSTMSPAVLFASSPDGVEFDGKENLKADGNIYRYKSLLEIPNVNIERVRVRIPHIQMEGEGKKLFIYGGRLFKIT